MKRETFEHFQGLPDAPLAMPKQSLERQSVLFDFFRSVFLPWPREKRLRG
ncbi:hypothetical protein IC608_01550 [Devosia sp. PTR5]|uniref:Uncharacterized protein n=1 Tax=Devosia oryzisoli TaxID=2774138 RepID=A0A927FU69_9HYPH|nr:hypothetical protein [Devosia oryzisoli]MBD8064161.1 hypothetical protein [Devosia oryzisoli]